MLSVSASRRFEQQQLLDSLRNYNPWGRAGGGAPAGDVRRRDLLSRNIFPQNQNSFRDGQEQPLPGLRPRQRPRKTYLTTDLTRPRQALTEPPDIANYDPLEIQKQEEEAARKFPHGWTTGDTFHFPSIDNKENANFRKQQRKKGVKIDEANKLDPIIDGRSRMPPISKVSRSSTGYERGFVDDYIMRKENNGPSMEYNRQGHHRAGGTPTRQLLQMTGGIELVPLMRARPWFRQAVPHENFSSQFANHLQKKSKANK